VEKGGERRNNKKKGEKQRATGFDLDEGKGGKIGNLKRKNLHTTGKRERKRVRARVKKKREDGKNKVVRGGSLCKKKPRQNRVLPKPENLQKQGGRRKFWEKRNGSLRLLGGGRDGSLSFGGEAAKGEWIRVKIKKRNDGASNGKKGRHREGQTSAFLGEKKKQEKRENRSVV